MKEIFIGEKLQLTNPQGANVQIGSNETILFKKDNCPENFGVDTSDFIEGNFSIVIFNQGALTSNELIKVKSPFVSKTKKQQLREMINDLDKVIQYRLTSNEEAIQQMSINGKSFVYESLDALMSARKRLAANLDSLIKSEEMAKGKSPIITIKARFNNPS
ncbi:hypothetical protein AADQ00_05860 [Escherichia coli]|uniref:hypothetical protein n=1 Tax=Enterobacteriaceae TaxID=543 RepID=UPI0003DD02B6|nr:MULTISPECIES: hypothetical protein [Enterobacteriaceae]CDK48560.1 hypothetical protein [Escherichia coli IS1]HCJ7771032.1 hypothetical protein [Citrobacter freundii]EEV5812743.1 hypothetical protein [Escherichia coli]EFF2199012.1 hypothetical protein [Escherichia coli]EFJ2250086.1 hypothetical protein [Escherichia coli]